MNASDEQELHRVSAMLATINESLPESSPLREGLAKAGLALSIAFIDGRREWIETNYAHLGDTLSEEQRAHLIKLGLAPGE